MEAKLVTQSRSREHSTWYLGAPKERDRCGEFNLLKSLINIITKNLNKKPHTNGMNISNHSQKYMFFKLTSFQFLSNKCFLIEFKRMLCDKLRIWCLLQWALLLCCILPTHCAAERNSWRYLIFNKIQLCH